LTDKQQKKILDGAYNILLFGVCQELPANDKYSQNTFIHSPYILNMLSDDLPWFIKVLAAK